LVDFFFPRSLRFWWRIVRRETELTLVLDEFGVKVLRSVVKTLPDGQADFLSQFANAAF
jgi:hypothetical protein